MQVNKIGSQITGPELFWMCVNDLISVLGGISEAGRGFRLLCCLWAVSLFTVEFTVPTAVVALC